MRTEHWSVDSDPFNLWATEYVEQTPAAYFAYVLCHAEALRFHANNFRAFCARAHRSFCVVAFPDRLKIEIYLFNVYACASVWLCVCQHRTQSMHRPRIELILFVRQGLFAQSMHMTRHRHAVCISAPNASASCIISNLLYDYDVKLNDSLCNNSEL